MSSDKNIIKIKQAFGDGQIGRREFLRYAMLLGMTSAGALKFTDGAISSALAAGEQSTEAAGEQSTENFKQGGVLKISMRVHDISSPHTFSWIEDSNIGRCVYEYLTMTDKDGLTHPYLAESWTVSDDLRSWVFKLRDVNWRDGRALTAEDVVWNIKRCLNPEIGSSMVGLMRDYMLNDSGDKLWDSKTIDVIDDQTFQLNLKVPQVAIPEQFFHYPMAILDPSEGGLFQVGSNGTGAFELTEHEIGKRAILKARSDYWGEGPYVEALHYIDLGDDKGGEIIALTQGEVHGQYQGDTSQMRILNKFPNINIYSSDSAATAVARMQVDRTEDEYKPFGNPLVRKAMRVAVDTQVLLSSIYSASGLVGEHHHVSPINADYARLPSIGSGDKVRAKSYLVDAGYPDGFDVEIFCKKDPPWELQAVQLMVKDWAEINVRVKINVLPSAQYWDLWDQVPFGFTAWVSRPLATMTLALAYKTGVPWNESHYANPEFDRLLQQAEGTLDIEERRKIMAEIEYIMQDEGPIIQPLWRSVFSAFSDQIGGFEKHPTEYIFANKLGFLNKNS